MSVLNQSGEEQVECPLCMEPLEVDDLHFYPCTCGYQICRFCWNRIREGENGLCPACRKAYPENPADFTPLSQEQVAAIKTEKKAREQKRRNKTLESRRALANVRVVQNNLVFVVGLPARLADPEILKRQEYFGKYGKIHKVVINQSPAYAGSQVSSNPSASAYVTYVSSADALRAIQGVNNVAIDGRVLKGSLGTTKYCANFMKNQPCPKPDCMYLHELGDPKASFTKEDMHAGLHQVYERKLHNQLLQMQRERPEQTATGNTSTNADKGSSKDGNQSNFIPTTVVTSSHINVVNSSKSKKESVNGSRNGSSSGASSASGKEAWPSLGCSPPAHSPARDQPSPHRRDLAKSQENCTSESSSPTQLQSQQAQTKNSKDTHTEGKSKGKENGTTQSKKSKDKKQKMSTATVPSEPPLSQTSDPDREKPAFSQTSVFECEQSYLTNDLDELESDRHSLLENHDLLDGSDHSLLEDDNTHNLLSDANNELMMMQRHREMLAGLVDSNGLLPHSKGPMVNGYGLLDRDSFRDRHGQLNQMNQGLLEKEMMMRERSQNEMLMRQSELMRHSAMDPKHYMPATSIGLDSASELLGANFHPNTNMLPPFGMRVDNSMGSLPTNMGNMSANMSNMSSGMSNMSANMGNMSGMSNMSALGGFMLHNQMMQSQQPMPHAGLVNGYDAPQSANEGRYLAENMDKFFTDFNKAQQMRLQHRPPVDERRYHEHRLPHNMLSAERLEMEHKQRMGGARAAEGGGGRAAGDGDDDLDFDPFKETQKAFAELMETEMMQSTVPSGDTMELVRRSRLAPPGFSQAHVNNAFGLAPRPQHHHQGYSSQAPVFSDWTAMDPAIVSTSVHFNKNAALSSQQQELIARFSQLGGKQWAAPKLPWAAPAPPYVPLPPGFAPAKQPQRPAECIDAK